jgi:hypothetical protein
VAVAADRPGRWIAAQAAIVEAQVTAAAQAAIVGARVTAAAQAAIVRAAVAVTG